MSQSPPPTYLPGAKKVIKLQNKRVRGDFDSSNLLGFDNINSVSPLNIGKKQASFPRAPSTRFIQSYANSSVEKTFNTTSGPLHRSKTTNTS